MQIQSPQKVARLICRVIDRVFKEMGRADELGSGVKNLFLFTKAYSGADPQLVEDDIFRIIIPLTEQVTEQTEQVTEQVKKLSKIIDFCKTPRSTAEIMKYLGLKHREHFRSKILQPLLAQGILAQTMPDAPKSPKQKYYSAGPNESGKFDKNGYP
jgi:ATP-dependent DNA helicase RecG